MSEGRSKVASGRSANKYSLIFAGCRVRVERKVHIVATEFSQPFASKELVICASILSAQAIEPFPNSSATADFSHDSIFIAIQANLIKKVLEIDNHVDYRPSHFIFSESDPTKSLLSNLFPSIHY